MISSIENKNLDSITYKFYRRNIREKIWYLFTSTITGYIIAFLWFLFIGQNIFLFISEQSMLENPLLVNFILTPQDPYNIYSYLLNIVTHNSILHLLLNSLVLSSFGLIIEERLGKYKYILSFVIIGIFSSIIQMGVLYAGITELFIFEPAIPIEELFVVGASGSILGMVSIVSCRNPTLDVYILFLPFFDIQLEDLLFIFTVLSFISIGMFGVGSFYMAHTAHISGIILGHIIGVYLYGSWRLKNYVKIGLYNLRTQYT